jgi:hypothetical protein
MTVGATIVFTLSRHLPDHQPFNHIRLPPKSAGAHPQLFDSQQFRRRAKTVISHIVTKSKNLLYL